MLELQGPLLARASEIAGGDHKLAERLGVSMSRLAWWKKALVRIPDPVFLKAVDMVLKDDIARASGDRRKAVRQGTGRRNYEFKSLLRS